VVPSGVSAGSAAAVANVEPASDGSAGAGVAAGGPAPAPGGRVLNRRRRPDRRRRRALDVRRRARRRPGRRLRLRHALAGHVDVRVGVRRAGLEGLGERRIRRLGRLGAFGQHVEIVLNVGIGRHAPLLCHLGQPTVEDGAEPRRKALRRSPKSR